MLYVEVKVDHQFGNVDLVLALIIDFRGLTGKQVLEGYEQDVHVLLETGTEHALAFFGVS